MVRAAQHCGGAGAHREEPYSDDGSRHWNAGEVAVPNTEAWVNPSETAAVELADGRVMLNTRSESKPHRRLISYSRDGAKGWSQPVFDNALIEPVCVAGMTSVKRAGELWILFSNPNDEGAWRNLTVRLSRDGGATWPAAQAIEPGTAGYSDVAVRRDGSVYCFYERGGLNQSAYQTGYLTVARFPAAWLASE